jgi:hypothetical protein
MLSEFYRSELFSITCLEENSWRILASSLVFMLRDQKHLHHRLELFEKSVLGGSVDLDPDPLERLHLLCHQLLHRLQLRRVGLPGKISCTLVQKAAGRRKFGANCSF